MLMTFATARVSERLRFLAPNFRNLSDDRWAMSQRNFELFGAKVRKWYAKNERHVNPMRECNFYLFSFTKLQTVYVNYDDN